MIPLARCPLGTERGTELPEEPKLDTGEAPEHENQLNEKDLDAVDGGSRRIVSMPPKLNVGVRRTPDPCEGGELT